MTAHSPIGRRGFLAGGAALVAATASMSLGSGTVAASTAGSRPVPNPVAPVYLGYRRADYNLPYAKFFTETVSPVQQQIRDAVAAPPTPSADIPPLADLATELSAPGYSKIENGYGSLTGDPAQGTWTAALTKMPGVTPEMWDWWFGWHSADTARYKLWHPEAHLHASLRDDLADEPGLTDKERYIGNVSYVDEYLPDYRGGRDYHGDGAAGVIVTPGISFVDPAEIGLDLSKFDGTAIVGRGGPQGGTDVQTLFVHQVRRVRDGCEMRSRFYVNAAPIVGYRPARPQAASDQVKRSVLPVAGRPPATLNLLHTGQEMNHLAKFLPALYREFRRR
ncbi:DAPG hydrolase family protein [Lentzea sp. HUAS12]|uniref:DAPG hydrolase family protein n=1 Tax=Lentzea sp. HUAS12 TaxID=2951806 RepID=UPI00209EA1C2|nr:hypothetical protein [Lentzea sp. HUAS12]USX56294.1 hypothetical protein ND450_19985 [Lentzea sp. HUAS12]